MAATAGAAPASAVLRKGLAGGYDHDKHNNTRFSDDARKGPDTCTELYLNEADFTAEEARHDSAEGFCRWTTVLQP